MDETQSYTPEPVPVLLPADAAVRVIENPPRSITTEQTPVAGVAVRLVAERPHRATVTVHVTGADLYVGEAGVTPGTGFKITDGGTLTIEATSALYGITTGPTATVYALSQHRDG